MPNANYLNGRKREWCVRRDLERLGFSCIRAASSHGVYDVVGVRADCVALVQVKDGGKPSPSEYKNLVDLAVPDGAVKLLVWYPPAMGQARVLYCSWAEVPPWCGQVAWQSGQPPKQIKMRGL